MTIILNSWDCTDPEGYKKERIDIARRQVFVILNNLNKLDDADISGWDIGRIDYHISKTNKYCERLLREEKK